MAVKSKKVKKWIVMSHLPTTLPPSKMDFIDPFEAEDKEKAAFTALTLTHFSLYRDKEMRKGRKATAILKQLYKSVVRMK